MEKENNRNERTFPRALMLVIAIFCLLVSFSVAPAAEKKPLVRLSYSESTQAVASVIGIEKGFFDEEGLLINAAPESSGVVALQALVGGSVDFAVGVNVRVIQALARDIPICALAVATYGYNAKLVVPVKDKETKGMAGLKGKTFGVQVGSGSHTVWVRYLKHLGLKESDFKIRNMETTLIPAALQSGDIEGALAWDPYASTAVEKGLARVVLQPQDIAGPIKATYPVFLYATCDYVNKKPDIVQKFVNAWVNAMRFADKQRDETVQIMQAAFDRFGVKLSADGIRDNVYNRFFDRAKIEEVDIVDSEEMAKVLLEEKRIKKFPNLRAHIRSEFVDRALTKTK